MKFWLSCFVVYTLGLVALWSWLIFAWASQSPEPHEVHFGVLPFVLLPFAAVADLLGMNNMAGTLGVAFVGAPMIVWIGVILARKAFKARNAS